MANFTTSFLDEIDPLMRLHGSHVNMFDGQSFHENTLKRSICVDFIASNMEHFMSSNQCNIFYPTNSRKNVANQVAKNLVSRLFKSDIGVN